MTTMEDLKHEKKRTKALRRQHKRRSTAYLNLTLKIGRLNKRINRKKRIEDSTVRLVQRYLEEAVRCTKLGLHYVWGGSHGSSPTPMNGPWDCSSYASHLDQCVKDGVGTMTTLSMMDAARAGTNGLQQGEGRWITHFVKDDHVITRIVFRGRTYWTQTGGSDNPKAGDGPCFWTPTASRIAQFGFKCHPKGL